ncbi:ATP-binding protein [Mumia sp. zg.B53]|uniref:ATP-binding protein n=1 Tax=Mumia sp. zg.B53 TaxID=2855449 RepID=UPI001C6E6554|nr:ATP-binding protein [Mumia sp. zg.B53]MBW9216355.1 ATP-binding protein [Mumia sp. zg.B53]
MTTSGHARITGLRAALEASPDNETLLLLLAEALRADGDDDAALEVYARLLAAHTLPPEEALVAADLALTLGHLGVARGCLEVARGGGQIEGLSDLESRIATALAPSGDAPAEPAEVVRFSDVGGLEDLKKLLHRMIVMPYVRPDLYAKYGRHGGGGVLHYGPPGCGKTLMARAVAGECGLPFIPIRIEDVVSPYFGASERNLADAFAHARAFAPCVVFIDELDALAYKRHRAEGDSARRLTNVLLQVMDGVGSDTTDILVMGASNAPWDVDTALVRPGRFDRHVFVPPPDARAREMILERLLRDVHAEPGSTARVAGRTEFFSGADLRALVERAADRAIDRALETGDEAPLGAGDIEHGLAGLRPSTLDWLRRARDYVEFSNADDRWDDVAAYLRSRPIRKRL